VATVLAELCVGSHQADDTALSQGGLLQVETPGIRVIRAWFQRLKPKYDEPLSNFAFNFYLRPFIKTPETYAAHLEAIAEVWP